MKTIENPSSTSLQKLMKWSLPLTSIVALAPQLIASTDHPPAIWRPACDDFFSSGNGKRFYVIHDMEGYYAYCVSASGILRRCDGSVVTVHYCTNGKKDATSDYVAGEVSQLVRDSYYAWHARCWSAYSMGTEHEGFASNPAWYTEAQYVASASITKAKCTKYGIAKDRNHVIAHGQKSISAWRTWAANAGYSSSWITCNTHSDPGPYWAWTHYMDLVKGTASTPSAPSSLAATSFSASQINLSWADNSGIESGFKVERATASAGPFTQIGTTAANIKTFASTGLTSGTTYYYRVRAYNASGNSGYSNTANATTKDTIPVAPTGLTATAASDVQINLAWAQTSPNEDGFRVYRSSDGTNYTLVATAGINAVSYNNTGLTGNRTYWYKVAAYNTAGNSAYSNVASDTTAPQAPSALTAVAGTGVNWNKITLNWTDNAANEVGFKIERGTASAGPFTQIATNATGVTTYLDTGLVANTTYYYRVRSYNANGNSAYSNTASSPTGNQPPLLTAIGNKTVASGSQLAFTVAASDPNAPAPTTTTWQNFTSFGHATPNETVLFNKPGNSASTSAFMDTSTNYTQIFTNGPTAWGAGNKALKAGWGFKTGMANYWVRLNTFNTPTNPNPAIALDQKVQFKFYASAAVKVGIGVRETGTAAAYGANGGTTGAIEWVGITNVVSGHPVPNKLVAAVTPVTLSWNIPFEPQVGFTGNDVVDQSGAKGSLEHVAVRTEAGAGAYSVWFDDFQVVVANNLVYTLDAGAPAGATIGRRNGKFSWTPSAGQVGTHNITVRVADSLGAQDFETINVTVTGTGNNPPVLGAIGNKAVGEGAALAFTATATDPDAGQTKTFTLDAGAPSGASINASSGAFTWTPSESQGPGTYPITVRVTDNGSPASNDFETISVSVSEVNVAPVLAAIANQTVNEGATLNASASATDSDVPANAITYTVSGPPGMTINSSSGAISYTPTENDGGDINQVTVTARDNGNPALSASRSFTVTVGEVNSAPMLTAGTLNDFNPFAVFDELDDEGSEGHNNACLFRVPRFSSTTSAFIGSTSYSYITNDFPRDSVNASYQALYLNWSFNTGSGQWLRLSTYTSAGWTNTFAYPNPTILLNQHVRFKIRSDKSIKVALGVRESGTANPVGFNGGITGAIEWVGATSSSGVPVPTRTVSPNVWTQLDFNLPSETIASFSGNGALNGTKGTLEHLAIVPNGGTGAYTVWVDDFEVLSTTAGSSITVDSGDTVVFTCNSTDSDLPAQEKTYSLAAAPAGVVIDDTTGVVSWKTTAADGGASYVITPRVTDNGTPALSGTQNITVNVTAINTPPRLTTDSVQEIESGGVITFDAFAQDDDVPAQTITYSMSGAPSGATINPSTGTFTWTPPAGLSTNTVTIRATDNGVPSLWDEQTILLIAVPGNTAPALSLGNVRAVEKVVNFETLTDMGSERVMFNKPSNSATTSSCVDTTQANTAHMTNNFPAGNANAGVRMFKAQWTFKTGQTDQWIRLNTALTGSPIYMMNPTINASARLKFDVHSSKSIKIALGVRETNTSAENGANGGTSGNIEFVGASSKVNGCPQPTRTIAANTWTTLEFDLPNEPAVSFTGNGVLSGGQQVLEHIALVGTTTGAHVIYLDNFEVVTTPVAGALTMKAGSSLTFTASAVDPDPGNGVTFGLDADFTEGHPTAVLDSLTGAFSWTPGVAETGTFALGVTADDEPTNGGHPKSDTETINVTVNADTLAPQSNEGAAIASGDTIAVSWESVTGQAYKVQLKSGDGGWTDVQTVTATGSNSSVSVTNNGADGLVRVVEVGADE